MPRPLLPGGSGMLKRTKKKARWAQMPTRLQQHAANNLGVIMKDASGNSGASKVRNDDLDLYDKYYEGKQYDNLQDWDAALEGEQYVSVRKRKPRINYNVAKVLVNKVNGKLFGSSTFPKFVVENDPDDTQFFRVVQQASGFRRNLLEAGRLMLNSGACFIRFYLVNGACQMEHVNAKYCYPVFDESEELAQLEVRYVYEDPNDKDASGKFKQKWYRLILTQMADILYDNPEYKEGVAPEFKEVERVDHQLGWVQGEWLRTSKHKFDPDGDSLIAPILDFIDELNYSLSQTSQAIQYNQDPQLLFNNMDEDELDRLIKSSQKGWNLGREGKAEFLESDLNGIEKAEASRDHFRQLMLEVVRVVLHDPEKMTAQAQSGVALATLNAPLVELVDELRTIIEPMLRNLLIKIGLTFLVSNERGEQTILETAPGFVPQSLDITTQWPPIFPPTLADIQVMTTAANTAAMANIISRESLTRWLAPVFNIDNVEEELQKIGAQPVLNPFGSFGGGF